MPSDPLATTEDVLPVMRPPRLARAPCAFGPLDKTDVVFKVTELPLSAASAPCAPAPNVNALLALAISVPMPSALRPTAPPPSVVTVELSSVSSAKKAVFFCCAKAPCEKLPAVGQSGRIQ